MPHKSPILRFPEFTLAWHARTLGKVAEVTSSKRVYLSDYAHEGIPFYRGKEISVLKNGGAIPHLLYISEKAYNTFSEEYGAPKKDDILITAVGTLGNILRIRDEKPFYFKDGNLIWLRNITEDPLFLEHLLSNSKRALLRSAIGSSQQALTIAGLKKISLNVPGLNEQQKIATFLLTIDGRISGLQKKIKLLQTYKKITAQKIFSLQSPGNQGRRKRLAEVADSVPSSLSANSIVGRRGNYKVYGATGVLQTLDRYDQEEAYIAIVKDGAGVGRVFFCEPKSSVLGTLSIIKPREGINTKYLLYALEQIKLRRHITRGTIPHIYFKDYSVEDIYVPDKRTQQVIAELLTAIDDKINLTEKELEQSKNFKRFLLQQMLV